ncbi:MAG TPA: potassium channel protein [Spirochaetota bacterium]|nr:potassium channel protein [Spirochaetota bacterium]HPI88675.1 potassium channel protein [Spirochaetota bacterium]HPR49116.1 potassium channel protein [Spirochaetota bacterium]
MKKIRLSLILFVATLMFGVFGYHFIEGMSLFDSLYMTVITISTVGFGEVHPLSQQGRVLTILLISTGIMIAAYTLGTLLRMFIEGEMRKTFGRRKVEKKIAELTDHYIICGFGRIGKLICQELHDHGKNFVVIENQPEAIDELIQCAYLYLPLDATADESLVKAGIMKAKGIVTAVRSDADNVFISLTAKGLKPDIFILARASEEKNEMKLKRAGASRVVSPYMLGGKRMAQVLIRPTVVDFIDIAVMEGNLGLHMEEMIVKQKSNLIGKNLIESNLRRDFGVIIVLIKKFNGDMIFNPLPTEKLDAGDVIVVMGKKEDMIRMNSVV